MVDPEMVIMFTAPPLPRVEAGGRVVGGASGKDAGTIAGGEVPMDEERETRPPPRERDEDSVEGERFATVGEGVNFGNEPGDDLVGEETSAKPRFRR